MSDILSTVARVLCPAKPESIYKGILPDAPDELIALFQYDAPPPDEYFDQTHFNQSIQARVRAKAQARAYSIAQSTLTALHRYTDSVVAITAKSPIFGIGQDSKQRYEYTINFEVFIR